MKPYYQDNSCTIYHGDCLEIMPKLSKVDLILTDPDYNAKNIGPNSRKYLNGMPYLSPAKYKMFCRKWFKNAYKTILEWGENPKTIVHSGHGYLDAIYKMEHHISSPMWLQVVHGENIENHEVRHSRRSKDIPIEVIKERFKINDV